MTVKTEKEITKEYIKGIVEDEANENYYLSCLKTCLKIS